MATYYDANITPSPSEWLLMSGQERSRLVTNYLESAKVPRPKSHALVQVLAETYLAQGFGPAKRAMNRQLARGTSRADAVSVLATCLASSYERAHDEPGAQQAAFVDALDAVCREIDELSNQSFQRTATPPLN